MTNGYKIMRIVYHCYGHDSNKCIGFLENTKGADRAIATLGYIQVRTKQFLYVFY